MPAPLRVVSSWFVVPGKEKMQKLQATNQPGFTLIELMVAISIVAILSTIGMVMYSSAQGTARDAKRKGNCRILKKRSIYIRAIPGLFV